MVAAAKAAKNTVTEVMVVPAWVSFPDEPGTAQYRLFCEQDTEPLDIDEQIFFSGYTAEELRGMVGKTVNGDFTIVAVEEPEKMKATYVRPVQKASNPADMAAGAVRTSASTGVERNGLHFYYGDEPKPGPEFFRERHSKTRPIVCLETGETFDGNPAAARPLHVSPAAISQAVRYGTPVAGLHFYHGDEPKPAPEFFKPAKGKGGKSPAQMAAAARAAAGSSGRPDGGQRPRRAV